MSDSTRHLIVHYHFFKNAGSTVETALARNFTDRFAIVDVPGYDKRIRAEQFTTFVNANPIMSAISSHQLSLPAPHVPGVQMHEILILRNPLDRFRSMYAFYKRAAENDDPLTHFAKCMPTQQFFHHVINNFPNLISNPQLNLIANGGGKIPDDSDLPRAKLMLQKIDVVGVVEMFDKCAVTAEYSLRRFFPHFDFSYVPENVTPNRAPGLNARLEDFIALCGGPLYRKLEELNRLDTELIKAAEAELQLRFETMEYHDLHLWEFRRRVKDKMYFYDRTRRQQRRRRIWEKTKRLLWPWRKSTAPRADYGASPTNAGP